MSLIKMLTDNNGKLITYWWLFRRKQKMETSLGDGSDKLLEKNVVDECNPDVLPQMIGYLLCNKFIIWKILKFCWKMIRLWHFFFTVVDLPEDVWKEGEALKQEIEKEENEKQAQMLQDETGLQNFNEPAQQDLRFKRLMHLLDRSKFYANFLLQRMQSKKEEEKQKVRPVSLLCVMVIIIYWTTIYSQYSYICITKTNFFFLITSKKSRLKGMLLDRIPNPKRKMNRHLQAHPIFASLAKGQDGMEPNVRPKSLAPRLGLQRRNRKRRVDNRH